MQVSYSAGGPRRSTLDEGIDTGGGRNNSLGGVSCDQDGSTCQNTGTRASPIPFPLSSQPALGTPVVNNGLSCTGRNASCTQKLTNSGLESNDPPEQPATAGDVTADRTNSQVQNCSGSSSCAVNNGPGGTLVQSSNAEGGTASSRQVLTGIANDQALAPAGANPRPADAVGASPQVQRCSGSSSCATQGPNGTIIQQNGKH